LTDHNHAPRRRWPPLVFLFITFLLTGGFLQYFGRFEPVIVHDTRSYVEFPFDSVSSALSHQRTPGYPLFLKALSLLSPSESLIPVAHYVVYCAGILVFYLGLCSFAGRVWIAACSAAALVSANVLQLYLQMIASDTIAAAAALAAIGLLLLYLSFDRRLPLIAILLGGATALCWLIRPAYLFVVPLIPLLGTLLAVRNRLEVTRARQSMKTVCVLALVAVTPLLAWCSLRWFVVQEFGVVSFGGYNLAGVSGQFLDQDLVAELPEQYRPLAIAALEQRTQLPPGTLHMTDADPLNYMRMERNYDITIWSVMTPAAQSLYGDDNRKVNRELKNFSAELIYQRPGRYAVWIVKSLRQAVRKLLADFAVNPFGLLLILTAAPLLVLVVVKSWWRSSNGNPPRCEDTTRVLFIASFCYAAFSVVETILVCPSLGRFTDAAALLFPAVGAAVVVQLLRQITTR
jgi:hypothetical protein